MNAPTEYTILADDNSWSSLTFLNTYVQVVRSDGFVGTMTRENGELLVRYLANHPAYIVEATPFVARKGN